MRFLRLPRALGGKSGLSHRHRPFPMTLYAATTTMWVLIPTTTAMRANWNNPPRRIGVSGVSVRRIIPNRSKPRRRQRRRRPRSFPVDDSMETRPFEFRYPSRPFRIVSCRGMLSNHHQLHHYYHHHPTTTTTVIIIIIITTTIIIITVRIT